ncbi:MAG: NADH-quinone oxidoreductase subunit J [Candidatus Gastranaerophilales bacterium]|nr:NADH-quinone oxidoreductase subunit J [Candidatus Gastranaerophilales bacterium]
MDLIYTAFFWIISFLLIVFALGAVFAPRIVYSLVSMVFAFLSVAGIFVLLNADFVAVSQVIIYAVGITIILLFAIMLTGKNVDKKLWIAFAPRTLVSFGIAFMFFLSVVYCSLENIIKPVFNIQPISEEAAVTLIFSGTTEILGRAFLTKYVLPFEILSILLLSVILGSAVIAKKNDKNLVNPTTKENR